MFTGFFHFSIKRRPPIRVITTGSYYIATLGLDGVYESNNGLGRFSIGPAGKPNSRQ